MRLKLLGGASARTQARKATAMTSTNWNMAQSVRGLQERGDCKNSEGQQASPGSPCSAVWCIQGAKFTGEERSCAVANQISIIFLLDDPTETCHGGFIANLEFAKEQSPEGTGS